MSDGWDARARLPACGARSELPGATVLGAEDRPGSAAAAAAAGSKCGSETGRESRSAQRPPPPSPRARRPGPRGREPVVAWKHSEGKE